MATVIILVMGFCFVGTNFLELFDWDELNFAEVSREMSVTGNLLQPTINYLPFHEKPPLFNWMQVASYEIFGVTPRGARFPSLISGIVTFVLLLHLTREYENRHNYYWWPLFFGLSLLPALYFQSGIIDPWFNLFILLGLWPTLTESRLDIGKIGTSALFLGLAVLTKGPVALLIAGICWVALLIIRREARGKRTLYYTAIGVLALLPIVVWVTMLWNQDGGFFAREFLNYQWRLFLREDAGHGGFPGYHVVVLLLGCFPAGWFALPALLGRSTYNTPTDRGMRLLFWVVLLLFSIVNTKIVHYSSLCYFPLAWFAARSVTGGQLNRGQLKWMKFGLSTTWILYTLLLAAVALAGWTMGKWLPSFSDPELVSRLQLPVEWPWYIVVPGAVAAAGLMWQFVYAPKLTDSRGYVGVSSLKMWATGQLALTGLLLVTTLYIIVPRIQEYTQGAAVAFFQEQQGKDVYVGTAQYKSYAHWYYAALPPGRYREDCRSRQCRFHGSNDLPLYFASPLRKTEQVLREVPDAVLLEQKGGFSFYLRAATKVVD